MAKYRLISQMNYQTNPKLNTEGLAKASISKRIREDRPLPNVKEVIKFGRIYQLKVAV